MEKILNIKLDMKYEVGVSQKGVGLMWMIPVEAESEDEAEVKAFKQINNSDYYCEDAIYLVDYIKEINEV